MCILHEWCAVDTQTDRRNAANGCLFIRKKKTKNFMLSFKWIKAAEERRLFSDIGRSVTVKYRGLLSLRRAAVPCHTVYFHKMNGKGGGRGVPVVFFVLF